MNLIVNHIDQVLGMIKDLTLEMDKKDSVIRELKAQRNDLLDQVEVLELKLAKGSA